MTRDHHLRDLARQEYLSGALEDEVKSLNERLRCGTIHESKVALAAFFGHKPSFTLFPNSLSADNLEQWLRTVFEWEHCGHQALARLLIASVNVLTDEYQKYKYISSDDPSYSAVNSVQAWLDRPNRKNAIASQSSMTALVSQRDIVIKQLHVHWAKGDKGSNRFRNAHFDWRVRCARLYLLYSLAYDAANLVACVQFNYPFELAAFVSRVEIDFGFCLDEFEDFESLKEAASDQVISWLLE